MFGDCISREDGTIGQFVFPLRLPWFACGFGCCTDRSFFSCCVSVLGSMQFFKHLCFLTSLFPWTQFLLYRVKARLPLSDYDCAASRCRQFSRTCEWLCSLPTNPLFCCVAASARIRVLERPFCVVVGCAVNKFAIRSKKCPSYTIYHIIRVLAFAMLLAFISSTS